MAYLAHVAAHLRGTIPTSHRVPSSPPPGAVDAGQAINLVRELVRQLQGG